MLVSACSSSKGHKNDLGDSQIEEGIVRVLRDVQRKYAPDPRLACGTGATAAALITARLHNFTSPTKVQVRGGTLLTVSFARQGENFANVSLTGPADFVFAGVIEI